MKLLNIVLVLGAGTLFFNQIIALLAGSLELVIVALLGYILLKSFSKTTRKAVLFDFGGVVGEGDYYTDPIKIRKGIPGLVKNLRAKNYAVALLTNQNAEVQDYLDKKHGLDKLFPIRIVSGKIGIKKPDPRIYKYAMQKLGSKPENTYFVDDQIENVLGAKKLGIKGIQFKSVQQVSGSIV